MTATNGDGKSVILKLAEPGTILGSNAWVTARPYEATFRNSASGSTGHSSVVKFLALLNHDPDIPCEPVSILRATASLPIK